MLESLTRAKPTARSLLISASALCAAAIAAALAFLAHGSLPEATLAAGNAGAATVNLIDQISHINGRRG